MRETLLLGFFLLTRFLSLPADGRQKIPQTVPQKKQRKANSVIMVSPGVRTAEKEDENQRSRQDRMGQNKKTNCDKVNKQTNKQKTLLLTDDEGHFFVGEVV